MKKILSLLMSALLMLTLSLSVLPTASAAGDMTFSFVLSASETSVKAGDKITVSFVLNRTDASGDYLLYSMQNEISYDTRYFALVADSVSLTNSSFSTATRTMSDGIHEKLVVSYVDFSGSGTSSDSALTVCTFALKALAAGTSSIENTDYKVNLPSGQDVYTSTANTVSVRVTKASANTGSGTDDDDDSDDDSDTDTDTGTGITLPTGSAAMAFTDVRESDWYYDSVLFVYEKGLFKGTSETAFSPNLPMTRAMFVTVLSRLQFGGDDKVPSYEPAFNDLASDWYKNAVGWGAETGIVSGTGNGAFSPDMSVTREQMAAFMYRYAKYLNLATADDEGVIPAKYSDAEKVSAYASQAMAWAIASGLINGTSETTLDPQGPATRAQVATIIARFYELMK